MVSESETFSCLLDPWYWGYNIRIDSTSAKPTRWMQISGNIFLDFLVYNNNVFTEDLIRFCDLYIYDLSNFPGKKNSIYYGFEEEKTNTVTMNIFFEPIKFDLVHEFYKTKNNLDFEINALFSSLANSNGSKFYQTEEIWHLDKDPQLNNLEGIIFRNVLKDSAFEHPENFDINHGEWFKKK